MKRKTIKIKDLNKELEFLKTKFNKKDIGEIIDDRIISINKEPYFFYYNQKIVPTVKFLQKEIVLKKIIIDMGAIKFVINGADIMRPGIVEIDENINKEDFIVVVDENNQKPLAVGIALFDSIEMGGKTAGKVIKNIHYVGDEIWNMRL